MSQAKSVSPHYRLLFCAAAVFLWTGRALAAPATDTTQAESFSGQSGVTTETCSEGGQDVTSIQAGDNIYFTNVDFGASGIQCFEARVASYGNGGFIELRLDSQTGTLIGTCEILPPTGGWQTWTNKACAVTGATGVHTLYLVFRGGAGVYTFTNNLFNLNWFKFHGTPAFTYAGWRSTIFTSRGIWRGRCALSAASGTAQVTVTPTTMRQRVDGFGGAFNDIGYYAIKNISAQARAAVMQELFDPVNGCKFTIGRIPIGISDYSVTNNYSYDILPGGVTTDYTMQYFNMDRDTGYNIPYIKAAQVYQPNLMVYGSPWSPPAWMKSNKAIMGTDNAMMDTSAQTLTAYAMYFRKFVQGYNQRGIPIFVVYPQNEPTFVAGYQPSCGWPGVGVSMRNFCSNFMWADFNANNIGTQIWMGTFYETNFAVDIQPTLTDATARTRITGCGTQRGGAALTNQAMSDANAIANHWHAMQTENWSNSGANNWSEAVTCAQTLIAYFEAKVNSFNSWNMVLDSQYGKFAMDWAQNSLVTVNFLRNPPSICYCPEFFLMKQVSYYVSPGAVSIASTAGGSLSSTAFKNPDGSIVIFVLNTGSAGNNVIRVGSQQFTASLLAASMNTFLLGGSQDTANWVPKISVDVRYTPPKQPVAAFRGIMTVYDIKGRVLKVIDRTDAKTGNMVWDRTDASGRKVVPGLYIIMNRAGKNVTTRKIMCQ
jgi:glucosylceramidase